MRSIKLREAGQMNDTHDARAKWVIGLLVITTVIALPPAIVWAADKRAPRVGFVILVTLVIWGAIAQFLGWFHEDPRRAHLTTEEERAAALRWLFSSEPGDEKLKEELLSMLDGLREARKERDDDEL
jgi:hypothetical protein